MRILLERLDFLAVGREDRKGRRGSGGLIEVLPKSSRNLERGRLFAEILDGKRLFRVVDLLFPNPVL